jgi:hypothetical protein
MHPFPSGLVVRPTITRHQARQLRRLLRAIADQATDADVAEAVAFWAPGVNPDAERGDLQTIAWLLRDAGQRRGCLPGRLRRRAHRAATALEALLYDRGDLPRARRGFARHARRGPRRLAVVFVLLAALAFAVVVEGLTSRAAPAPAPPTTATVAPGYVPVPAGPPPGEPPASTSLGGGR